jgi:hypothetical protein
MKVVFVALLVVASAFGAPQQSVHAEGPETPIDDPIFVEHGAINITVDPILELLVGSVVDNLVAEGLSTLWYNIDINAILLSARVEVNLTRVTGNATYQAEGYLDARPFRQESIPSGNFTGNGLGKVSATNIRLQASGSIFINLQGRVQLSRLVIEQLNFDTLAVDLGVNFNIGGGAIDWPRWSENAKQNIDQDLANNRNAIQEKLRGAANGILRNYTLAQLICLINGGEDCLGL